MKTSKFTYDNVNLVKFRRNRFLYPVENITTQSVGDLCPFLCEYITPGESHKTGTKMLGRGLTPFIKAPIGNLVVDMQFYFVPFRILWEHWEEFQGANKTTSWADKEEYKVPMIIFENVDWSLVPKENYQRTIFSHLGIPYGNTKSINAFSVRAYAMIWDEWFRNQNVQDPILIPVNSDDVVLTAGMLNSPFSSDNIYGYLAKSNKFRDRFTSMLPEPQKGSAPTLSINLSGSAPVVTGNTHVVPDPFTGLVFRTNMTEAAQTGFPLNVIRNGSALNKYFSAFVGTEPAGGVDDVSGRKVAPANLWTNFDNMPVDTNITANDLRLLMQSTVLLERMARSGTRYREILLSQWGVVSSDASLQVPEFLNGVKFPLQYHQVAQTSGSSDSSRQANISSFAYYSGYAAFRKSFNDFGVVIGLSTIRQIHLYQQGVRKQMAYSDKFDFFNSVFGHISEQPVYGYELYSLNKSKNDTVIGYQEAWSELRSGVSQITGGANSLINNGVDVWHFGDVYDDLPVLSPDFVKETSKFVDRTINVTYCIINCS